MYNVLMYVSRMQVVLLYGMMDGREERTMTETFQTDEDYMIHRLMVHRDLVMW